MASKENEEREHPGDKKTGVKLIYQGQEKKVIIVSTVRSLPEYVSMDSQNKLGFLFNSKRFNLGMRTENGIIPNPVGKMVGRTMNQAENSPIMWTNQIQVCGIKYSLQRSTVM